ncbi:LacI family DNA-binding transcriptional regulator [Paenibacillus sp. OAS669]|uniref:LacI family DNA-binding transcriptional regulator n=1 Tax=Paenibacillus sp. OAS669 TaxID=2663821 RepID=UPI00178B1429|nr:LacI family DNA-binding transcriptional regulator [Paenibacillus sp. OAS669]MBE1440807.1 DNA-binding LacI/PurR family transcriptional regulator [Paenibacillus sp. OAS669]
MIRRKKVSMQDIADYLQISKNAVSIALGNKKGVSQEMRERIWLAAKELGYGKYNEQDKKPSNILVLVPERIISYEDNDHFLFYHNLIWTLEKEIRNNGYNAVIARIDGQMEEELQLPNLFHDIDFTGAILFGIVSSSYTAMVAEQGKPFIMLDSYHRGINAPSVTSANIEGAYEAVTYLAGCGHRRIGFIGPTNLTTSHEERWMGYWTAMRDAGLPIDPAMCLTESKGFNANEEEIGSYWERMQTKPTAIFCGNDRAAILLIQMLRKANLRIPEDVSVMGYDDLQMADTLNPGLTTMRVDVHGMCQAAIKLLNKTLDCKDALIRWSVPPELVIRESVKAYASDSSTG